MNYKWTVLFLIHAANKHTREHIRTLIEILKKAPHREDIKVLLLYSALQYADAAGVRNQVVLRDMAYDPDKDLMELREVTPGYGDMDIGDDKKLQKIFSDIKDRYPFQRFLLFTWDHGSGFGIFKTNPGERNFELVGNRFLNFEMDCMRAGSPRSIQIPEEMIEFGVIDNEEGPEEWGRSAEKKTGKTSMLTNDEIRNTIKQGLGNKKIDLLVMMNCAMQMIETGYALHDTVDYLVAPETCIFWAGYDYKRIIGKLCSDPDIATEELGRYTLDTIEPYYKEARSGRYFNDLVVSLVKPAASIEIKLATDNTAAELAETMAASFEKIRKTRQTCEDLTHKYVQGTPYHYIDFLHCLAAYSQISEGIDLKKLKQAVQNYIVHIIKGGNYRSVNPKNGIGEVNGCTIYHPPTACEADEDFYYDWFYKAGRYQTLFAASCAWKDFLKTYFRYDRMDTNKKNTS